MDSIPIGGLGDGGGGGYSHRNFRCDNGYKLLISRQNAERIIISFNNGKDTFVIPADRAPAASGEFYVANTNTVKWHEKNGSGILTYPDNNYRTTGKIWDTVCHPR